MRLARIEKPPSSVAPNLPGYEATCAAFSWAPDREETRDALVALGHPVHWHTYPMQHAVHPHEIADIAAFLKQVLEKPVHAA